jgi:hypothetical protein
MTCCEPMTEKAGIGYGQGFIERLEKLVLSGKMDNELFDK